MEVLMRQAPILSQACAVVLAAPAVLADSTLRTRSSRLRGTPAISTKRLGSFRAKINQDNTIDYESSA